MMKTKSIRSFGNKPLLRTFDMSKRLVRDIVPATKVWYEKGDQKSPDEAAFEYYTRAHWFNYVVSTHNVDQPLGEWEPVVQSFFDDSSALADRMFHYLMLICTRETRHGSYVESKCKTMVNKFGEKSLAYFHEYAKTSKPQAVSTLLAIEEHWPGVDLGTYTTWMVWMFNRGKFPGGYGGKAWAEVAEVLRKVVHGEITWEMMIDLAFNSAHNNGPIFNKGMLFQGYTHQFKTLLDVQRGGQMPMLFSEEDIYGKQWFEHRPSKLLEEFVAFDHLFLPTMSTNYVDWCLVKELGAVTSLSGQVKYQIATYGENEELAAKKAREAGKKPMMFSVMEGVQVEMLTRENGEFVPLTVAKYKVQQGI